MTSVTTLNKICCKNTLFKRQFSPYETHLSILKNSRGFSRNFLFLTVKLCIFYLVDAYLNANWQIFFMKSWQECIALPTFRILCMSDQWGAYLDSKTMNPWTSPASPRHIQMEENWQDWARVSILGVQALHAWKQETAIQTFSTKRRQVWMFKAYG